MENQLLTILNYELRFDETEACIHFAPFMGCINSQHLVRQSRIFRVVEGPKAREAAAAAAQLPLTPPPSEGSSSDGTPRHFRPPSSQHFSRTSKRHSRFYNYHSAPTTVLSFISAGTSGGSEVSFSMIPTQSSTTDTNELEEMQTVTELPRSMSDELERATGQHRPKPLVLRAVPAAARRKSRSQRFASASVNVKPPSDERVSDEPPTLSEQRLSSKEREGASRASRPPFDDFWRKIQSNLSKLTLVNSDSQVVLAFGDLKETSSGTI